MQPILEIRNISKKFIIQHQQERYLSIRDSVTNLFKGKRNGSSEEFWALKDVSFDVYPGDSLGIIGRNGAGKSTLLKILSKITPPTEGKIVSRGRIASLLEVGTGFHHELSGKENIFLNGSILGMRRREILTKFDEIVDFSGVEKFLDTPLKRYSSGMQLRLAFAVAAFLQPEILIIDEVLAVGDAEFQRKCMEKMNEVNRTEGRTVLFVSHNLNATKLLCNRTMVIDNGKKDVEGESGKIIDYYLNKTFNPLDLKKNNTGVFDLSKHKNKKYEKGYGMVQARLFCDGAATNEIISGSNFRIEIDFSDKKDIEEVVLGLVIKTYLGQELLGVNNRHYGMKLFPENIKKGTIVIEFEKFPVYGEGNYSVDLYFGDSEDNYDTIYDAFNFLLKEADVHKTGKPLDKQYNLFFTKDVKFSGI